MQRITPKTSILESYTVQRVSKDRASQDQKLAEAGLPYDEVFTVPVVQFGTEDVEAQIVKILSPIIDKLVQVRIDNGTPAEVAKAFGKAAKHSVNLNAGLSDAVKAFGLKNHPELGDDFFGTAAVATGAPKAVTAVSVKL